MAEVRRLGAALGAEILGVDLSRPPGAETVDLIRSAFLEHIVLTVRDQSLPPTAQVAFTEHFGAVEPHPLGRRPGLPDHPGVCL